MAEPPVRGTLPLQNVLLEQPAERDQDDDQQNDDPPGHLERRDELAAEACQAYRVLAGLETVHAESHTYRLIRAEKEQLVALDLAIYLEHGIEQAGLSAGVGELRLDDDFPSRMG